MTSDPEVICLPPTRPETNLDLAWQALMVEFGIDFAFDDDYQLPEDLPESLDGVKAICTNQDSLDDYLTGPLGPRLRAFADSGGVVFGYWGNELQNPIDENATRGALDMVVASAGLTLNHPRLRKRLQARTFARLYAALRAPYFEKQIEHGLSKGLDATFNEPYAYNILHTMEAFAEYDPDSKWDERLREVLDRILQLAEPTLDNIDRTTGLPVFVRMSGATGDPRYRDFAGKIVRQVASMYPRIDGVVVLQPLRDRDLWNECLAHFPPACVAVGDPDLVDLAVHTAHRLHARHYDPEKKLWYHWSRDDTRGPAIWARGHAWAMTGLVGILRHLPDDHVDRGALIGYLDEMIDGLKTTQNEEGLWHNVMDMPELSRVAGRASGMVVYCLAEARRAGWLAPEWVDELLHRAWRGVRGRIWRDRLCTNCCGTGAGATLQHYLARPMLFTGASTILRAGVNYVLAFGEDA